MLHRTFEHGFAKTGGCSKQRREELIWKHGDGKAWCPLILRGKPTGCLGKSKVYRARRNLGIHSAERVSITSLKPVESRGTPARAARSAFRRKNACGLTPSPISVERSPTARYLPSIRNEKWQNKGRRQRAVSAGTGLRRAPAVVNVDTHHHVTTCYIVPPKTALLFRSPYHRWWLDAPPAAEWKMEYMTQLTSTRLCQLQKSRSLKMNFEPGV